MIPRYLNDIEERNIESTTNDTLGDFVKSRGYSQPFISCYLVRSSWLSLNTLFFVMLDLSMTRSKLFPQVPVCASIWSSSAENILQSSAVAILKFCKNHHLLQVSLCHFVSESLFKIYIFKLNVHETLGCNQLLDKRLPFLPYMMGTISLV